MSEQWRGPGRWAGDDGLWYPPTDDAGVKLDEAPESRWDRRPGWIDESEEPERHGPIQAGNRIIDAATGPVEVIDLRTRYREDVSTAEEPPNEVPRVSVAPPIVPPPIDELLNFRPAEPAPSLADDRLRVLQTTTPPEEDRRRSRSGPILLLLAALLAVASGVLGALWVRERDNNDELRLEIAQVQVTDDATSAEIQELTDQVRTLEIRNEQLDRELQEARAQVAPVPEGRISVIDIPFDPVFVGEVRGQFIAVESGGGYVVWGTGVEQQITDSGVLDGSPTGLFAARDEAFVSTDEGQVEIISLTGGTDGLPIETGLLTGLEQDNRQFWGFAPESSEVRRYRTTNGRLTTSVAVPTSVAQLTVGAGAVWALGDDGTVYRINTADFTLTPISAGQDLIAITAGPDALWTLSAADGSLRRVDAVSGQVLVTVPVGRDPVDAVFSGESVWVALRSGTTLVEVDTRTSAVVSRTNLPAEPIALSPGETGVLVTLDAENPLVRVASSDPTEG